MSNRNELTEEPNIFRSEDMVYLRMYVDKDVAHDFVQELGWIGKVEFKDLNPTVSAFQRRHAVDIKRCEEIQRKFRVFRDVLGKSDVVVLPEAAQATPTINDIELTTADHDRELSELNRHFEELTRLLNERLEQLAVLKTGSEIFNFTPTLETPRETPRDSLLDAEQQLSVQREADVKVNHLSGSIATDKVETFERIVFRATRGNCLTSHRPIDTPIIDPKTGKTELKSVFMVFFAGSVMSKKISKIAESFGASVYQFPDKASQRDQRLTELQTEIADRQRVLKHTADSRRNLLLEISSSLPSFEAVVAREIAILHTLNMFDFKADRRLLDAEGWCPRNAIRDIHDVIDKISKKPSSPKPIFDIVEGYKGDPPTYFQTNKFTKAFQAIVDAYGVADYKEFNPMPFTVITFPFLFAVMFGDFGHGILMFLFALYLVFNESYYLRNPPGEIFGMCFGGRYVILLMSIFSIFTGLLYNDTFALSMDIFGSSYTAICDLESPHEGGGCLKYHFSNYYLINGAPCPAPQAPCLPVYNTSSSVYPFGLDPIWKQATNELSFTNSLKMKLSVVLGVIQMLFGVTLSGLNHIYTKNWISFIHEFIPQVLFMSSVFGYMVIVIFIKWSTHYSNTHCAPSVLGTFIDMFLSFGSVNFENGCADDAEFISGQSGLEKILIVIAFISVPWMLLTKPLLMKRKHAREALYHKATDDEFKPPDSDGHHGHSHHFDFAEEMVHQIIHTIEYVLGAVSNTASYLRLWALSLAHAQLSTVFWEKVMVENMVGGNWVVIMISFMVWVCCTFAVLMIMESLSAFLHALRLHWVEFNGKFYHGAGRKFTPFKFADEVTAE